MKYINVDGNTAAAKIAYKLTDVAAIYPITPSSAMAELCDELASNGEKNIFNQTVLIKEMQSEAGAAGAVHGCLTSGALTTTFTASQGLLLMIPNMYKIAGEALPCVFHVSARAIASHALSIFGDHSDVMSTRSTGFNMLASANVQECLDHSLVAHLASIECSLPFIHFFDGFRTSHEIQKIVDIDDETIIKLLNVEKLQEFKNRALSNVNPCQRGTAQNPDIFFQNREAINPLYDAVYSKTAEIMEKLSSITGRKLAPFEYYGAQDATNVIVSMGSSTETIKETIDELINKGEKVGLLKVVLYRPFNSLEFTKILPNTTKIITVLDRTKECGAIGEPLYLDVVSALNENKKNIEILCGRYGLGGKEFTPNCVYSIYKNMNEAKKSHFTVGINDDVTHLSLPLYDFKISSKAKEIRLYGLGSDGSVSASKNTIKIIGEETNKYVQGYFEYDSKKSGSLTISHLRISVEPIKSTYTAQNADFIGIHNYSFVNRYEMLAGIKDNAKVLINSALDEKQLLNDLPAKFIERLQEKNAELYVINAQKLAKDLGLGNKINILMQSAFFYLSNVIPFDEAKNEMLKAIKKTYAKKGENVINMNIKAVELAPENIFKVNISKCNNNVAKEKILSQSYYDRFIAPIDMLKGNDLPVSAFDKTGTVPTNTSCLQKRGVALETPTWIKDKCIQCGKCSAVCPHACLRGVLVKKEDLHNAPASFETKPAIAKKDLEYKMQLSPLDCTGCGVCASVCPVKAIIMELASKNLEKEKINFEFSQKIKNITNAYMPNTVKNIQFEKPYFEYNYACAGCGETPYIKILTQLFGDKMIVANATGCSSIYSGSAPACPYAKNEKGMGPAWANSLFEDNAEFGLGMSYARTAKTQKMRDIIKVLATESPANNKFQEWFDTEKPSVQLCEEIIEDIKTKQITPEIKYVIDNKSDLYYSSIWIIGGDGWAYDIGYSGLDHLLASNENVNVLVLDSEVYSNTGGQASKSTPKGASVKFASNGKPTKKKDLAGIAIAGNNAYVAQVSLGANMDQTIKALAEAEAFNGPSLVIAYTPCINHGFNMSNSSLEMKKAVDSGYWNLFRYNPETSKMQIDCNKPTMSYKEFLMGETRYSSLAKKFPEESQKLFNQSEEEAKQRYEKLIDNFENEKE